MKKVLQFVALLLTFSVSAQPVFADSACDQRACSRHLAMDCCPPTDTGMTGMAMDTNCGQLNPKAAAPMLCTGNGCCMVSAAIVPAISSPRFLRPVVASNPILPSTLWIPATLSAIKRPYSPRPPLPTQRYILFRDFRI